MFKKIPFTPTASIKSQTDGNWKQLQQILETLNKNLMMLKSCVHRKKFGRILQQINNGLGGVITNDSNTKNKNIIKSIYEIGWINQANIYSIIGKIMIWNEELQNRIIEYKKNELGKFKQIIDKRPYEPLVIIQQNNILIGQFPKIRKSTLAQYMLLYNQTVK